MKFSVAFILLFFLLICGCRADPPFRKLEGEVWTTRYHITYQSPHNLDDSIFRIMKDVEASLSPFREESLISRINRNESSATDSLIRRIFRISSKISLQTRGNFDPTVGPLVNLWGFGHPKISDYPDSAAVLQALKSVGIRECRIVDDGRIIKKSPDTEFNFSAIAKGLGCDLIAEMFRRNRVVNYMIEIGGEIALNGHNGQNEEWTIQIDRPIYSDSVIIDSPLTIISPGSGGIATSGNYRKFQRDKEGHPIFGHTISPLTGYPVITGMVSATVIAPDCATADGLATACMAISPDSAYALITRLTGIEALLVSQISDSLMMRATPGFPLLQSSR